MNDEQKKSLKYIKTGVFVFLTVVLCAWLEDLFSAGSTKEAVGILCDCFTVPGIVFLGIGGLTWISHKGGFDSFGYMFSNFAVHNIWVKKPKPKFESFYDYKQAKDEKGRKWLNHFVVCGGCSLAIGILLLAVYSLMG